MDAYWRPPTICPSAKSICWTIRCSRAAEARAHQTGFGHWGTSPGLNMLYVHLNRVINKAMTST